MVLSGGGRVLAGVLLALAAAAPSRAQQPEARAQAEAQRPAWIGISFERAGSGGAVVVRGVQRGSPAAAAGIQAGDTLVRWAGRRDVLAAIQARPLRPGERVVVRVRRAGQRDREVRVVAQPRPAEVARDGRVIVIGPRDFSFRFPGDTIRIDLDSLALRADTLHRRLRLMLEDSLGPQLRELERVRLPELRAHLQAMDSAFAHGLASGDFVMDFGGRRAVAGAELTPLNPQLGDYFGTDRGVLVLRVAPGTPAARAGLRAGDVVVAAGGAAVGSVAELRRTVERAQEAHTRSVELQVVRKGRTQKLEMRWE